MSARDAEPSPAGPRRLRRGPWLILAALLVWPLLGLGIGPTSPALAVTDAAVHDNFFEPATLEIPAGTTVVWHWDGRAPHNIVGKNLESPVQTTGTFSYAFAAPGTYDYVCTLHRGMRGQILVIKTPD